MSNTAHQIVLVTRSATMIATIVTAAAETIDQAVQTFGSQVGIEVLNWFHDFAAENAV